jgi:Co/Zn/Cd efflux system component
MENKDLHEMWKNIDSGISNKSKPELNNILNTKVKSTINELLLVIFSSSVITVLFLAFLVIAAIHRSTDKFYVINNSLMILIALIALIQKIFSFRTLNNNKANLPLKEWLKYRIELLSGMIYNNTAYYILPLGFILAMLSVRVYFSSQTLVEMVSSVDSIVGLIIGGFIGLSVAILSVRKIKRKQSGNLDYLRELYNQMSSQEF